MNSTSSKITIGAAAGALTTIIVWILGANHIPVPAESAAAGTVLVTFLAGFFTTEIAQPKMKGTKTMINEAGDTLNGTFDSTPQPTAATPVVPESPIPTNAENTIPVVETNLPTNQTPTPAETPTIPMAEPTNLPMDNPTTQETVTTLHTGNVLINGTEYTPVLTVQ